MGGQRSGAGSDGKDHPLGAQAGEYCATDRAMLVEDPTGVRIVYDLGASVAGARDLRLGDVHVMLLGHAHGEHIGTSKAASLNAGVFINQAPSRLMRRACSLSSARKFGCAMPINSCARCLADLPRN